MPGDEDVLLLMPRDGRRTLKEAPNSRPSGHQPGGQTAWAYAMDVDPMRSSPMSATATLENWPHFSQFCVLTGIRGGLGIIQDSSGK